MKTYIKPFLGLLQGCLLYGIVNHTHLSSPLMISLLITILFPLFALQVKLPAKNMLILGLGILITLSVVYGYAAYHMLTDLKPTTPILIVQFGLSGFILFVFYCAAMEEKHLTWSYPTLFGESWQVILKLFLGKLLVLLTYGLCWIAGSLFQLLNLSFVHDAVTSHPFLYIMPSFFFGISMLILEQYDVMLTKFRNISLSFCHFLYPLFIVISLSFFIMVPMASKPFTELWRATLYLGLLNILLFNGLFQGGLTTPPYTLWFRNILYVSMIVTLGYLLYTFQFPWAMVQDLQSGSFLLIAFLSLLIFYHLGYCLAIFCSTKSWLNWIKPINTGLALWTAILYLGLALQP